MSRYIAIDWSGSASIPAQRKFIVVADWQAGAIEISSGRTRAETIEWLAEQAHNTPDLIVGLDFAFSYPAWFVRQQIGSESSEKICKIEAFWKIVAGRGEDWLQGCASPFWGRRLATGGGRPCPQDHRAPGWLGYRRADRLDTPGVQPKSPFQVGGAGAVGTGSIRGIPGLLTLRAAGFSIWPFHPSARPMAMEIYPRSFTGPVNKSSREARESYLRRLNASLTQETLNSAAASEDAFDALCSVIGMAQQLPHLQLRPATDEITLLEGSIFPGSPIL